MTFQIICNTLSTYGIKKIEKNYNAKFVFESCIKNKFGEWCNFPVAIFYTEEYHPKGSNYFAIFQDSSGNWIITDGISATENFKAVKFEDKVYFSRYRHDMNVFNGGFIDGGRDYVRWSGSGELYRVRVVDGELELSGRCSD